MKALERIKAIEKGDATLIIDRMENRVTIHKDQLEFLLKSFRVMREIAGLCIAESDGKVRWGNENTIDEEFEERMKP